MVFDPLKITQVLWLGTRFPNLLKIHKFVGPGRFEHPTPCFVGAYKACWPGLLTLLAGPVYAVARDFLVSSRTGQIP